MGFLKRLVRRKTDVPGLLQRQDLVGLVRALDDESPAVVRDAARAIAQFLDDPERAESAAKALAFAKEGLPVLREYLMDPGRLAANRPRGAAGEALMRAWMTTGGVHGAAARAILDEVEALESKTQQLTPGLSAKAVGSTSVAEPVAPLDDEALRPLLRRISGFDERGSWQGREYEHRLEQQASWDDLSRRLLTELKASRLKERREYDEALATVRLHTDDPALKVYIADRLNDEDPLERREAVRLLGNLKKSDWVVAALTEVARSDPYQARRSTSSIDYTDQDVAEMHMETYYELREEAERALVRLT